jgi:hypothetical protein
MEFFFATDQLGPETSDFENPTGKINYSAS